MGTAEQSFFWKECEFIIEYCLANDAGDLVFEKSLARQVYPPREEDGEIRVRPGEIETAWFLASVDKPGLYLLTVKIKPFPRGGSGPVLLESEKRGYWTANTHLTVE